MQDYSQWVNEAQLGEQVTFAGWVKGKQKQELLQNARILLLPSRHEGMPMSILEAMAYGEAVVSTRVGGIPEVVEEGGSGFLIEPDDEPSLYRTIQRLLDDRGLAERMGRRGREIVKEKFDLEQIHRQLYALYSPGDWGVKRGKSFTGAGFPQHGRRGNHGGQRAGKSGPPEGDV